MKRREFLECTAILFTGATASQLGFSLSEEQRVYLATAPNYIDQKVTYLTPEQRATLAAMTETIIPRTETPGAIDADVPRYIELMAQQWMNDAERAIFDSGLASLMNEMQAEFGKPLEQLDENTRSSVLQRMEDAVSDHPWFMPGSIMGGESTSDVPFICQVKELTVFGFFTSEVGGAEVLRYDPMPMQFESDTPLGAEESSWSAGGFR